MAFLALEQVEAVALVHQPGDLAQLDQHFLALGLRRVRGEHQAHPQAVDEGAHVGGAQAGLVQGGDGAVQRIVKRAAGLALAQHAHALLVLGDVNQLEVGAEGLDEQAAGFQAEASGDLCQVKAGVAGAVATAGVGGAAAHELDQLQHILAVLLADRLAQQAAEQVDIGAEVGVLFVVGFRHGLFPRKAVTGVCRPL